jgi:phosphoglycolate phosphatase
VFLSEANRLSKSFTLLVFDWDGTLMDSIARIVSCVQTAIQDIGLPHCTPTEIRNIIGLGLQEAIVTLFPKVDEKRRMAMAERYKYYYSEADPTPMRLFKGVEETLNRLHAQGYLLAIATGKGRCGLERALAEAGVGELFHATRCADETFSKPHPRMLLELLDKLMVPPSQTLMIGDSEYDMQMAINAGTSALAVSYGVHDAERLAQYGPLACLDELTELETWLEKFTSSIDQTTHFISRENRSPCMLG